MREHDTAAVACSGTPQAIVAVQFGVSNRANHSNMVFPTRCGLTGTGRILWRAGDLVHHFAEVLGLVEPVEHHGLTQCMPRIVRENETS